MMEDHHNYTATNLHVIRLISTRPLHPLQDVHSGPINLIVFKGSSGKPHLRVGFALRCVQRFSSPNLATQRCTWRHNWDTSGSSTPVLSY